MISDKRQDISRLFQAGDFAVEAKITLGTTVKTVLGILDEETVIFGDARVTQKFFECATADIQGIKKGAVVTIGKAEYFAKDFQTDDAEITIIELDFYRNAPV